MSAKAKFSAFRDGAIFRRAAAALAMFACYFLIAVWLQNRAGAYRAELSGYPDEPAHFLNGLLVKEYITTFPLRPPIAFAEEFYMHRPKIAIGHWPPVLYIFEGLWFLVFGVSRASALAMMAIICASLAASIRHVVRGFAGELPGALAGVLFVCLSVTQVQTSEVMADMLVALFGFWATLFFARFLSKPGGTAMAGFSIFALLAIFTKNNGLYLFFVPPPGLVFANRLDLIKNRKLWTGVLIAGVPSALWVLWTFRFAVMIYRPDVHFFLTAWTSYAHFLYAATGPSLLLLAAAGEFRAWTRDRDESRVLPRTLLAAMLSVIAFQSVAPTASIDPRFLIPAIAAEIPLMFYGLAWIAEALRWSAVPVPIRAALALAVAAVLSPGSIFAIPRKQARGFSEIAGFMASRADLRRGVTLISSSSDGEGLLISEAVMRYPPDEGYILRGIKVLAEADWMGRNYASRFQSTKEVFEFLNKTGVRLLVIDERRGVPEPKHQELLLAMTREYGSQWRRLEMLPGPSAGASGILVFERAGVTDVSDQELRKELEKVVSRRVGGF